MHTLALFQTGPGDDPLPSAIIEVMTLHKLPPPVWVAASEALDRLVLQLSRQKRLAVDTESNSLHAYRERVCLIQFSTADADYLVDPLSLDDLTPLGSIFSNVGIEKVFHAAEYDLICLGRDFGFTFAGLFDTMAAARILGYQAVGLESLLASRFGIRLDKRFQRADWARRPLTPEQVDYARMDTRFLLPLRDMLTEELEAKGRLALARDDFALACSPDGQEVRSTCPSWERIDSRHELSARGLTVLQALCQGREALARRYDRPLFKIVSNRVLLDLARLLPQDADGLLAAGLTTRQVERFGPALLEAVHQGLQAPLVQRPVRERPPEDFLLRLEALKDWRKQSARDMQVESDVVLPRRMMYLLAEKAPRNRKELADLMAGSPWRLAHFGERILNALGRS
jgi:ribonuclease D